MVTAIGTHGQLEPLGIVVRDGGADHSHPRIMMWYWADEKGADEVENPRS